MFDFLDDILNNLNDLLPGDLFDGLDLAPEDAASLHDDAAAQIAEDPSLAGGSMAAGWAAEPPTDAYDPFMDDLVADYDATVAPPGGQTPVGPDATSGFVGSVIGADPEQVSQIGRIAEDTGAGVGQSETLFAGGIDSSTVTGADATTSAASEVPEPEPSETTEFPSGTTVTNPYTDANNNVYETREDYMAGTNAYEVTPSTDGSDNQAEPV